MSKISIMRSFTDGPLEMGKFCKLTVLGFHLQLTHQTTEPVKTSTVKF